MLDGGRNDVLLAVLIERGESLQAQIVRLGRARRKDNFLGTGTDDISYVLPSLLARLLCIPAELVRSAVGVAELASKVGKHGIQHAWIRWSCGLIIKVERLPALAQGHSEVYDELGRLLQELTFIV